MTTPADRLQPWTPSPRQRDVLERYAVGYRWYTASRELDIPDGTMANWLEVPEFRARGEAMRAEISRSALPMYGAVIERAQRVLMRVRIDDGDGDIDPDDARVEWAERILRSTLWPVLLIRGGAEPRDALRALGAGNPKD